MSPVLAQFHPLVREWFTDAYGRPTDVQRQAWPHIAAGEHLLVTAPTGSGKTLTAFLWAINRFITGSHATGATRVLYISPLKALNNDIQRNLNEPLEALREKFTAAGEKFPDIDVRTRSGDTDQSDRRRMLRHPPDILITTPESLNLLLSSRGGRGLLGNIETLILDEIHSLVDNKRGAYLVSAVERLVLLSGEFQRLALSATVNPLDRVARFIAGFELDVSQPDYRIAPRYARRPVSIIESAAEKRYDVTIRYPKEAAERPEGEKIWDALSEDFVRRISANRSTLLFANSRALCEKLTLKINTAADDTVAYAHHGSLSREIRTAVEEKLKSGDLSAIVATSSLEMGIDIGALDEVLLIQCPMSISSAIQRIGRAGHQVGEISRGTIYPTHPQDFMEAAVLTAAMRERDIEPITPVACPLDVLAQVIISMTGMETWQLDDLFVHLKCSDTFSELTRTQFDLVINMLAGRYAESRIRELNPRVSIDRMDQTVSARPGALLSLYLSGGVIPDRGYFQLRHLDSNARLGELDEEFVWEARLGQVFTLGTQQWQIHRITHNDVMVLPGRRAVTAPPFWSAEQINRDYHFSERITSFLEQINATLRDPVRTLSLCTDLNMDQESAGALVEFLTEQTIQCGCDLPHRHHLVVEQTKTLAGKAQGFQILIHTFWGARVNRPLSLALEAAWKNRFGVQLEVFATNDCLVLQLPHEISADEIFSMVPSDKIDSLIRQRLEGSGFFSARFRECAGRALLLSKSKFGERKPLWMSRLQSRKLMDSVLKYDDFPILLETWRTCMQDEFDIQALEGLLDEVAGGAIRISEVRTSVPSPMAQNVSWNQVSQYMYQEDQGKTDKTSNLSQQLLDELLRSADLRPGIPADLISEFEQKRQRLAPGYGPQSPQDLLDWTRERLAIPAHEWQHLVARMVADNDETWAGECISHIDKKLARLTTPDTELILCIESVHSLVTAFFDSAFDEPGLVIQDLAGHLLTPGEVLPPDLAEETTPDLLILVGNWLQSYGPLTALDVGESLGIGRDRAAAALNELLAEEQLVTGHLVADSDEITFCDVANLEVLLRMLRQQSRPALEPLSLDVLPLLLHIHQHGQTANANDFDQVCAALESLRCYAAPAALWETELLPSRVPGYTTTHLDRVLQESQLAWIGHPNKHVSFCFPDDLDLAQPDEVSVPEADPGLEELLPDPISRYDLSGLMSRIPWPASKIAADLWKYTFSGQVSNDTFAAMRQGLDSNFQVPDAASLTTQRSRRGGRGSAFSRWKSSIPYGGNWYRVNMPGPPGDILEVEEIRKERVRVLLDRYGILFRELLLREPEQFRWSALLRSLRLMEMSGELFSGYFVNGIPGPQFISHRMYRILQRDLPGKEIHWLNATDPHSLCGIGLPALRGELPRRVASNHLVYRGQDLVMISRKNGKDLEFRTAPDDPDFPMVLGVLKHLLYRSRSPVRQLRIEKINGKPATRSEYLDALRTAFELVVDYKDVTLQRQL